MAEPNENWFVRISLKAAGFIKGLKDVKTGTDDASKSLQGMLTGLKQVALSGGAILGVGAILKSFSGGALAVDKLSVATGENIKTLQAWKLAAEDMGVSGESAMGVIGGLNAAMGRIRINGFDQILEPLARLGISARKASGQLKSGTEILRDFARATMNMDEGRAHEFASQLGIDDETFYMIRRAGGNLDAIIAKKTKLASITKADIEQNRQYMQMVSQLNNLWKAFANQMANVLIPVLRGLGDTFGWILQFKPALYAMMAGLTAMIVGGLITAAKASIAPILAMGMALWAALAPIIAVIGPIVAGILLIMYAIKKIGGALGIFDRNSDFFSTDWSKPSAQSTSGKTLDMYRNIQSTMPGSRTKTNASSGITNNNRNISIENINVQTQATDSRGIASGIYGEMQTLGMRGGTF